MTCTAIGACPASGRRGIGIATYSIRVGGGCPFIERGIAAVSTQPFANPALCPIAMAELRDGTEPERVLAELEEADPGFAWRQVVIAAPDGRVTGDEFAVFGTVLAGEDTVDAMAAAWRERAGDEEADSSRCGIGDGAPGVAAFGERALAGHGEGNHGIRAEAEVGLGAVGGDSLRPGLGEAAGLAGRDQQAQPEPAVPLPIPPGSVDGSDEGGAQANRVTFSGRDQVTSYSSVYGIFAAVQRIAATKGE